MARPNALQFLKKGKLLAGAVFPRFVATWNWLVGAFDSFCGDQDINPNQGYISVDRTNPDRPIIRFDAAKIKGGGGVEVDNKSVGTDQYGKVEIRNFHDTTAKDQYSLARTICVGSGEDNEVVERNSDGYAHYQRIGKILCGSYSNVVFTENADGNIEMNVYWF